MQYAVADELAKKGKKEEKTLSKKKKRKNGAYTRLPRSKEEEGRNEATAKQSNAEPVLKAADGETEHEVERVLALLNA